MSNDETTPTLRAGSPQDLSRRLDRLEDKYADLAKEVASLTGTVARVESNQNHATELNKLRFDALDSAIRNFGSQLGDFIKRFDGVLSGEIETIQSRQGRELVTDYQIWRKNVEERLDGHDRFETQGRLLGRVGVLLVTSNVLAIAAAVYSIVRS